MKSKYCWAAFIPVTIIVIVLKIFEALDVFPSLPVKMLSYSALGLVVLMFAINIVFVAMDKKTSPAYLLTRNIPAAIFLLISAAMITSKSALRAIVDIKHGSFDGMSLALVVMGMITAICFVVVSLAHLQGRNFLPRMGALLLAMPVWAGLVLVNEFLENRTRSLATIDEFRLIALAFAMVFLFKLSMIIATIDGKNPVKAMYLYGLPMAALCLAIGITDVMVKGFDYSENVFAFALCSLGIYALCFIWEITKLSRTKEEQVIKYDLDDYDEEQRVYGAHQDNFVAAPEEQTGDYDYDYASASEESESYVTSTDENYTDDYDYDYSYGAAQYNDELVVAPEAPEGDDAIYVDSDVVDDFEERILGTKTQNIDSPLNDKEAEYDEEQMARIDKLIEDINS